MPAFTSLLIPVAVFYKQIHLLVNVAKKCCRLTPHGLVNPQSPKYHFLYHSSSCQTPDFCREPCVTPAPGCLFLQLVPVTQQDWVSPKPDNEGLCNVSIEPHKASSIIQLYIYKESDFKSNVQIYEHEEILLRMADFCKLLQLLWKNSIEIQRKMNVSEEVWGEKVNTKIISPVWNLFFSVQLGIAFCRQLKGKKKSIRK